MTEKTRIVHKGNGISIQWAESGGSIVMASRTDFARVSPVLGAFTDDVDLLAWLKEQILRQPEASA